MTVVVKVSLQVDALCLLLCLLVYFNQSVLALHLAPSAFHTTADLLALYLTFLAMKWCFDNQQFTVIFNALLIVRECGIMTLLYNAYHSELLWLDQRSHHLSYFIRVNCPKG